MQEDRSCLLTESDRARDAMRPRMRAEIVANVKAYRAAGIPEDLIRDLVNDDIDRALEAGGAP